MEQEAQPDLGNPPLRIAGPATRPNSEQDALDVWWQQEFGQEPDELRGLRRLALAILNDALARARRGSQEDSRWLTDTPTVLTWLNIAGVRGVSATRIASYLREIGRDCLYQDTHKHKNRK